jgi:hypothetical protein
VRDGRVLLPITCFSRAILKRPNLYRTGQKTASVQRFVMRKCAIESQIREIDRAEESDRCIEEKKVLTFLPFMMHTAREPLRNALFYRGKRAVDILLISRLQKRMIIPSSRSLRREDDPILGQSLDLFARVLVK